MHERNYYKIGDLINPLPKKYKKAKPVAKSCYVKVASRVDTFLCNHHYFVNPPKVQVYPVNSINFVIDKFSEALVEINNQETIEVHELAGREPIIIHTALIMKKTLGFKEGITISAKNLHSIEHGGLGSSASLQTAVALAINQLFGNKIGNEDLIRLLAQNYGEESDRDGYLTSMASIGGASAAGLLSSDAIIIGGENEIWAQGNLPEEYKVIVAIPEIEKLPDGMLDMALFEKGFEMFKKIGNDWGKIKEKILQEQIIPEFNKNNLAPLFESINFYTIGAYGDIPSYFKNRWSNHSLFMDEFIHTFYSNLFSQLSQKKSCFFVSSGGPAMIFITRETKAVRKMLQAAGIKTIIESNLHSTGPVIELR
jgi:predicted sugar kinase